MELLLQWVSRLLACPWLVLLLLHLVLRCPAAVEAGGTVPAVAQGSDYRGRGHPDEPLHQMSLPSAAAAALRETLQGCVHPLVAMGRGNLSQRLAPAMLRCWQLQLQVWLAIAAAAAAISTSRPLAELML